MKSYLSLLLLIIIIMSVLAGCSNGEDVTATKDEVVATQDEASATKDEVEKASEYDTKDDTAGGQSITILYKPYVQNIIDSMEDSSDFGQGSLYDINGDGIKELILLLHRYEVEGYPVGGASHYLYTICTIEDDTVVPLIEEEYFFAVAGGPNARVIAMTSDDETLLSFNYMNNANATRDIYSLDKTTLTLEYDIEEYIDVRNEGVDEYCIINGEKYDADKIDEMFADFEQETLMGWDVDDSKLLENFISEL